jgi:hypothetical protein
VLGFELAHFQRRRLVAYFMTQHAQGAERPRPFR